MENWALYPDVLEVYARHYKTGEVIPVELVKKIKKAEQFAQATARGFRTILEKGGTDDPMALYRAFRGREPSAEPLLRKRGLKCRWMRPGG